MAKVFVSYSSRDRDRVDELVDDLHTLGHDVWFDQDLKGGQVWWDRILASIRACDVFMSIITPYALQSTPCRYEYTYANDCNRPIIPVLVDPSIKPSHLPALLLERQIVNYSVVDRKALLSLAGAFTHLTAGAPLPDPLPTPPPVPISPLVAINEQLEQLELNAKEQAYLLFEIKRYLAHPEFSEEARASLEKMSHHPSLLASIYKEAETLLQTPAPPPTMPPQMPLSPVPAPGPAEPARVPEVASDQAQLLLRRPNEFVGNLEFVVYVDEQKVGTIMGGKELRYPLAPGRHILKIAYLTANARQLDFEVAAGQVARFMCKFEAWHSTSVILQAEPA
jgi:hypothetical protein